MVKSYERLDSIVEKLSEYPITQSKIKKEIKDIRDPNDIICVGNKILINVARSNNVYEHRAISYLEKVIDKANEETRDLSTKDHLTGLFNRRCLDSELKTELALLHRNPKKKTSIMMLDIDHFKQFNDNYGHNAGDSVLVTLSDIISKNIRNSSLFRYGGEEFFVLFRDTSQLNALGVAHRLNQKIANTKMVFTDDNGNEYRKPITISAGIVEIDDKSPIWLLYGKGGRQLIESYIHNDSNLNEKLKSYLNRYSINRYSINRNSTTKREVPTEEDTFRNIKEIGDFLKSNITKESVDMNKIPITKYAIDYVVKRADRLLYHVKRNGRNNVAYMKNGSIEMIN